MITNTDGLYQPVGPTCMRRQQILEIHWGDGEKSGITCIHKDLPQSMLENSSLLPGQTYDVFVGLGDVLQVHVERVYHLVQTCKERQNAELEKEVLALPTRTLGEKQD